MKKKKKTQKKVSDWKKWEELAYSYVKDLLETIQNDMYKKATERRDALTFEAKTLEDMERILNTQPGFIHADWCGSPECEARVKEIKGCKSRCIDDSLDKFRKGSYSQEINYSFSSTSSFSLFQRTILPSSNSIGLPSQRLSSFLLFIIWHN